MKRKFRPYLDIVSDEQLKNLLNNQKSLSENMYPVSKIKEFSKEGFRELVERFKNFYRYRPKAEYAEYINDIIYHLIVVQFYLHSFAHDMMHGGVDYPNEFIKNYEKTLREIADSFDEESKENGIKYIKFLVDEICEINKFIVKHFGQGFYSLKEYTLEEFLNITFGEYLYVLSELQTKVFILANRINHFRLKMIVFNLITYRTLVHE